jgi:cystathionine beta-synthase
MRRGEPEVFAVSSTETLGDAIDMMSRNGISQVPVIDGEEVVGSLSETVILNTLLSDPDARGSAVGSVMAAAIPVVPPSLHLEHLSAYLEQEPGAVLLKSESGGFRIITKSDLIRALSTGKSEAAITA